MNDVGSMPSALLNARILTFERAAATVSHDPATAVLIEDGRIARLGDDRTIRELMGARGEILDLGGAVLAPGFVDSHIHAFDCAMASLRVSCLPPSVDRLEILVYRLRERASTSAPGVWIVGEGYDDMRLAEGRHPTRWDLDDAVPDRPAIVTRVCGHMTVANSRALEAAGIGEGTPDPPGGAIVHDGTGTPTGLLLEEAQALVLDAVPPIAAPDVAAALPRIGQSLLDHGITTICEALLGPFHPDECRIWTEALEGAWPGPRVVFLADPDVVEHGAGPQLPIIGTKLFADGVVTGGTAALSEPFVDGGGTGMLIHEEAELEALVRRSVAHGLPVGIHAMGDRGIAAAVKAIRSAGEPVGKAATERGPLAGRPARHRIEHCSLPGPSLEAIKTLRIVPVPQPVFLYAEGEAYLTRLGAERCARAYPLRTMLRRGLRPALSSDAPATSSEDAADPWLGVAAAATRTTWAGSILGAEETISVGEAIACYTANGASALSQGDRVGSIEVGKLADLVVLPEDPLVLDPSDLAALRPELVLLEGRKVAGVDRWL